MKSIRNASLRLRHLTNAILPTHGLEPHFLCATIIPLVLTAILYNLQHTSPNAATQDGPSLITRNDEVALSTVSEMYH